MGIAEAFRSQVEGKAIMAHPALMDRDTPITIRGDRKKAALSQRDAMRHMSAYGGDQAIDWVFDCVKLIAETSSAADWHFEDKGERLYNHRGPDTPSDARLADDRLIDLFEEPNPYTDWAEMIELLIIDYLMVGNAYWLKWRPTEDGKPLALYRLAPPFVKVIPGDFGPEGYEYEVPGMGQPEPLRFKPDQVLHFRSANPHSPYLGLGNIKGGGRPFDLEIALTDTQASYYEKHAQPSMVLQSERRVPDAVFNRLKKQLRGFYSGPKNSGEMMVLEAGLKYQSVSPNAAEAAFENLSKMSRDRILAMFRVPAPMLGIMEQSNLKITDAQRVFDTKTIRPLLDKVQKAITRAICDPWDVDFIIEYDYIMPVEDRIKLTSEFGKLPGVRVREVREFGGLDPLGDERDDIVLNLPGVELDENGQPAEGQYAFADASLSGEAGRPPKAENTRAFPEAGGALPKGSQAVRKGQTASGKAVTPEMALERLEDRLAELKIKDIEGKAVTPTTGAVVFDPPVPLEIKAPQDTLLADRETEIDVVTDELKADLADAAKELQTELSALVDGKAFSDIKSRVRKSKAWEKFRTAVGAALERAARAAMSTAAIQQSRLGNVPDDDIDYDALTKSLVYRADGVTGITNNLKNTLTKKLDADASPGEIDEVIQEHLKGWADTQAETIALTESTHAYNEAVLTVAEAVGSEYVGVHDGDDHDQPCIDADGAVWPISYAREHRLEHPRCRRGFTPVPAVS